MEAKFGAANVCRVPSCSARFCNDVRLTSVQMEDEDTFTGPIFWSINLHCRRTFFSVEF